MKKKSLNDSINFYYCRYTSNQEDVQKQSK